VIIKGIVGAVSHRTMNNESHRTMNNESHRTMSNESHRTMKKVNVKVAVR